MTVSKTRHVQGCLLAVAIWVLFLPICLPAQEAARDALSIFPADTQQLAYTNLPELQAIPQYPLIREHLLSPQIRSLEDFLRPAGINAEKDVNEIVLGWRGDSQDTTRFFGIVEGQFDTDQVHQYFVNNHLPFQHDQGYDLYAFGSGAVRTDLFFTFLNSSTAAFGRLTDLKALLGVQGGGQPALVSNPDFRDWEGELEGTAPQWGIATGKAAANEAIPWFAQGKKLEIDASALFGPVKAVLYRVNWSDGFVAHLSVVCQSSQSASGLAQLFTLLQKAGPATGGAPAPAVSQILQNLQVQVDGSRLDLVATASVDTLTQLLNNAGQAPPH